MTTAMVIFVVALAFAGVSTPRLRDLALKLGFVAGGIFFPYIALAYQGAMYLTEKK